MAYEARVLADSVTERGDRLTTLEVIFPRFVLAEFNTHRMLSRNTASSRAIPVEKQLAKVLNDPFVPEYWGANKAGMQATEQLSDAERYNAEQRWLESRDYAVLGATALIGGSGKLKDESLAERIKVINDAYGYDLENKSLRTPVHKQTANRMLEPYMWHTALVTATDWSNFMALRAHEFAQPEIRTTAYMMRDVMSSSKPTPTRPGEFHLPLVREEDLELPIDMLIKVAIGRCARVSYMTHDGRRDPEKDVQLYDQLLNDGHMSPMEHVATPMNDEQFAAGPYLGNFRGWVQHRKTIPHESNFAEIQSD